MKMPYGKHKGTEISRLPSDYLKWVAEHWDEKTEKDTLLCLEADQEYQFREKMRLHWEKKG